MNKNFSNSSVIIKLIVTQIAISIFGLMLAMACSYGKDWLLLSVSFFAAVFYIYLIHRIIFELGQYDGVKISSGRMNYNRFKGLLLSLAANSINIVLGLLAFIGKLSINDVPLFQSLKGLSDVDFTPRWAVDLYNICNTVSRFLQGMYTGIASVLFNGNVLVLLFMPLPAMLISFISYVLGVRYHNGTPK